jgi:hypothetical protein
MKSVLIAVMLLLGACDAPAKSACKLDHCGDEHGMPVLACYCKIVDGRNECFKTRAECDATGERAIKAKRAKVRTR